MWLGRRFEVIEFNRAAASTLASELETLNQYAIGGKTFLSRCRCVHHVVLADMTSLQHQIMEKYLSVDLFFHDFFVSYELHDLAGENVELVDGAITTLRRYLDVLFFFESADSEPYSRKTPEFVAALRKWLKILVHPLY